MLSPLKGLKILDFSTLLPGPYATMLMADMGASVTRVAHPTKPDLTETLPPYIGGTSALSAQLNHKKDCLKLDLKQPESLEKIKSILSEFDVVIEQFRPGVMAKLGLDFESLKQIKPNLIYCSITGYGQTGPYADRAGHDINYLALSGIASYSGDKTQGPSLNGIQIADMAGGSHHAVMSILAAVIHKQSTGEGQYIDVSMTDCAFSMNIISGAPMLAGGHTPRPQGELLNGGFFYDYYPTSDGRYLSVGGLEPKFIERLASILDYPSLTRFALNPDLAKQGELKQRLSDIFSQKTFDEWRSIFANEDVCVEPVLTLEEAAQHPHFVSRQSITETEIKGTNIQQLAHPVKYSQ
ncbi:CaiB/BaiF CoA transferase family protein [Litoribrevibacter euphylliae]|uniref:CaiB/BaiF CoA transferase family protein n=1 Tax=Litoribrevibacter euphylliae TaxID=1834034 RepID=A0ABV7HEL2_9GAMM